MAAQLLLLLGVPLSSHLMFAVIASAGATPVLGFAIMMRYFPKEIAGRANAALGVLNMGSAFALQCLSGLIIAQWPADGGHYPAVAHQEAMAVGLGLQMVALGFFLAPMRRLRPTPMAHAVSRALRPGAGPLHFVDPTCLSWRYQGELARRQRAAWAFAAAASAILCVGLAATLSTMISRPAVAFHIMEAL
jgi:hypothetical protein